MTTVLVVDDEPIVRDVVVRYLKRDGFDTLEAGDGDAARELIERSAPHLVVLDVMLPGTDGLSLCRWIRTRGDLPVIMLTARGEEADRIVGLELGADDYVTKPFSPRELATRVRTVLRREQPSRGFEGSSVVRRARARCGDARGASARRAAAADGEGVRPALLPRVEPAQRLLARPAHEPRLGLRGRARHGHRDRAHPAAPREDRGATLRTRFTSRRYGASATGLCRDRARPRRRRRHARRRAGSDVRAPPAAQRAPAARRASRSSRSCCRYSPCSLSGWVMFHMGDDVKILAVAAASASAAVAAALVLASSIARRIDRLRAASATLAAGDLGARAPEGGPRELAELGQVVQRDGRQPRKPLRRPSRARRRGEPRSPRAGGVDRGDARGDRGRSREPDRVLAPAPGSGEAPDKARRRPLRARPHRRRRARPRAPGGRARAARRVVRPRLRGRGARP